MVQSILYFAFLLLQLQTGFAMVTSDKRAQDMEYVVQVLLKENENLKTRVDKLEAQAADLQGRVDPFEDATTTLPEEQESIDEYGNEGPTGSNDTPSHDDPLPARLYRHSNSSDQFLPDLLQPPVNCGSCARTAFYVYLSGSRCYRNGQIFKFDKKVQDIGNGYHVSSGVYVPQNTGVYVISWTVAAAHGSWFSAELMINKLIGGVVMTDADVVGSGSGIHPATGVAVVYLRRNDHVFIRFKGGHGCTVKSDSFVRTSFSGWLL